MKTATSSGAPTRGDASPFLPAPRAGLARHRLAAEKCRGCPLYKNATQVVFGEGKADARIVLVGEQPGDQEDVQGHPFVGPAGKVLDRALKEIGLDRSLLYVTNAVKHFKWKPAPRGKRRLHSKPGMREIHACFPWLEREIALVKPAVIVLMGATAGQAVMGSQFRVGDYRGKATHDPRWEATIVATMHPSAILRAPDHESREQAFREFSKDLALAQRLAR